MIRQRVEDHPRCSTLRIEVASVEVSDQSRPKVGAFDPSVSKLHAVSVVASD
jgi:hypothetical protein